MKIFKGLLAATISIIGLTAASTASAVAYKFVVVDPTVTQNGVPLDGNSYTFFFDSAPTPTSVAADHFTLTGSATYTAGVFGAYRVDGDFNFYTTAGFGGLDTPLGSYFGDQLFTGTLVAPVFKLGVFQLDVGSLTISAVDAPTSPVPETATWGMMILGFGMMGGAMRRRSTTVTFA